MQAISTQNQARRAAFVAQLTAAIDAPPKCAGNKAEGIRLARKAKTARKLVAKLAAAPYFYPSILEDRIQTHGIGDRDAICYALRVYFDAAYTFERLRLRREATAAQRAASESKAGTAKAAEYRRAAFEAAQPQADASDEENARAAAGFARLLAAGAYS